jgi:hypothetical protein
LQYSAGTSYSVVPCSDTVEQLVCEKSKYNWALIKYFNILVSFYQCYEINILTIEQIFN